MTDADLELRELAITVEGLTPLTERQVHVAAMVAHGLTDKQIAARLRIDDRTVRVHVVALSARLGIPTGQHTRVHIARWWWEHDLPDVKPAA